MNTKNFLIGGIVGGVLYFLLGYLFYGVLLNQYFKDHAGTATGVDRAMDQFQWWALILGNVLSGFLLSYVFAKSGVASLASGLIVGGILGFLMSCSYDLIMYATTNLTSKHNMLADVGTFTVMSAITGAIIGAVMSMGNKATVTTTM
jgi:sensor histidine kinase YesM